MVDELGEDGRFLLKEIINSPEFTEELCKVMSRIDHDIYASAVSKGARIVVHAQVRNGETKIIDKFPDLRKYGRQYPPWHNWYEFFDREYIRWVQE